MALPKPVMAIWGYLPESAQESIMQFGMQAMQNPVEGQLRVALAMLPANFTLLMLPHFVKIALVGKHFATGEYDNEEPREAGYYSGEGAMKAFQRRCGAAHSNSLECFPLISAAILSCYVTRAAPKKVGARRNAEGRAGMYRPALGPVWVPSGLGALIWGTAVLGTAEEDPQSAARV